MMTLPKTDAWSKSCRRCIKFPDVHISFGIRTAKFRAIRIKSTLGQSSLAFGRIAHQFLLLPKLKQIHNNVWRCAITDSGQNLLVLANNNLKIDGPQPSLQLSHSVSTASINYFYQTLIRLRSCVFYTLTSKYVIW